jgi:hypothetical protein
MPELAANLSRATLEAKLYIASCRLKKQLSEARDVAAPLVTEIITASAYDELTPATLGWLAFSERLDQALELLERLKVD